MSTKIMTKNTSKNTHHSMFDKDHFYCNWFVLYQNSNSYLHMLHGLHKLTHDPVIVFETCFVIIFPSHRREVLGSKEWSVSQGSCVLNQLIILHFQSVWLKWPPIVLVSSPILLNPTKLEHWELLKIPQWQLLTFLHNTYLSELKNKRPFKVREETLCKLISEPYQHLIVRPNSPMCLCVKWK